VIHFSLVRWSIRSICVILWCGIFFLFLYIPSLRLLFFQKPSINILAWPDVFNASYLADFEKETGIQVHVNFFEFNEELLVKLRTNPHHGYDLIMPSDHMAQLLIKEKLVKKIDTAQLTFFNDIYQELLFHYYDPNNEYTIPYFWGIYGLGVVGSYFSRLPRSSWSLIFDKNIVPSCVCMINDAREAILIAAQYLFGRIDGLADDEYELIKQLLLEQKKWVLLYSDLQVEYVLGSEICPVIVTSSADIAKIIRWKSDIHFMIPKEGSFILIDSFAIPATSTKDAYVYQFLNYLYQPTVFQRYVDRFGFFSPLKSVSTPHFDETVTVPTENLFKEFSFFRADIPEKKLHELWIALKA